MHLFDRLRDVPPYSEALDTWRTAASVVALRNAAAEAHAALVLTRYRGRVPAKVRDAIEWLTGRCSHSALHDKPLAVMGRAAKCYTEVWSRRPMGNGSGAAGSRVVEPITVPTLREAVRKLAGEFCAELQ